MSSRTPQQQPAAAAPDSREGLLEELQSLRQLLADSPAAPPAPAEPGDRAPATPADACDTAVRLLDLASIFDDDAFPDTLHSTIQPVVTGIDEAPAATASTASRCAHPEQRLQALVDALMPTAEDVLRHRLDALPPAALQALAEQLLKD